MIRLDMDGDKNKGSGGTERTAFFCTGTYYGSMRDTGAYALFVQANELASRGICEASVEAQISIPADMDKSAPTVHLSDRLFRESYAGRYCRRNKASAECLLGRAGRPEYPAGRLDRRGRDAPDHWRKRA